MSAAARGVVAALVAAAGIALLPAAARAEGGDAAAALRATVVALAGIEPPRSAAHPQSMRRAARLIAAELTAAGLRPREQRYTVDGATVANVTALLGSGSRPRLVVGAHYDVAGEQPGADDNASGVAALLHVGRRLAGRALPLDVELIAYALEEPPHFRSPAMGSARHAAALRAGGVEVRAMLALEMLGYYSDAPDSQRFPDAALRERFPSTGNFLAVVGRAQEAPLLALLEPAMRAAGPLPVYTLAAPAGMSGIDLSDHRSFWAAGFPALLVTDTAFLRNPHYHQPSDRPETLDYTRLHQAAEAVVAAVLALATVAPVVDTPSP